MSVEEEQGQKPFVNRTFFWPALAGTLLLLLIFAITAAILALSERSATNQALLSELLTVQAEQVVLVTETPTSVPSDMQAPTPSPQLPITVTIVISATPTYDHKEVVDVDDNEAGSINAGTSGGRSEGNPPTLQDDFYIITEDTILTTSSFNSLLANDTPRNTLTLRGYQSVEAVNGALTLNEDGTFTYEPNNNYYGAENFIYQACSFGTCGFASVHITVQPVNDAPLADDDTITVGEDDVALNITDDLLANDRDEEDNGLTISGVETANPERVIFSDADKAVQYDPGSAFNYLAVGETAVDIFQYILDDGQSFSTPATVTVTVHGQNDLPLARNDSAGQYEFTVAEDELSVNLTSSLLSNYSDPDETDKSSLTIHTVENNNEGGTAVLLSGEVTYNPNGNYASLPQGETITDIFTYTVVDRHDGVSSPATVTMTIQGVNQPPDLAVSNLSNPVVFSSTLTAAVDIATTTLITDVDNATMDAFTIRFAGSDPRPDGAAEYVQLTFQGQVITSTGNTMSLSSAALPIATWEAAAQTAQYINSSPTPTPGCRQFEFQVTDADGGVSPVQSIMVQVDTAVCPPAVTAVSPAIVTHIRRPQL